ncbi:hypothetical protein DYB35_013891, partial [Aphanomyces astaci]
MDRQSPKRMPKTLFKMLRVHFQWGNYGDAPCPTLRQVQQSINYVRTKELFHKSTVPAVEEALQHWILPTAQEDQEIHHPFVFGVEKVDGKLCVVLKFESELEKPWAKKPTISIRMKTHFNRLLSRGALTV